MEKTRNITFITTVSLFFFSKSLCQVVVNVSYKFALSLLHSRHRVDCLYCVSLLCHAIIRRDPAAERALCGDRYRALPGALPGGLCALSVTAIVMQFRGGFCVIPRQNGGREIAGARRGLRKMGQ